MIIVVADICQEGEDVFDPLAERFEVEIKQWFDGDDFLVPFEVSHRGVPFTRQRCSRYNVSQKYLIVIGFYCGSQYGIIRYVVQKFIISDGVLC